MTDNAETLSPAQRDFITRWGEVGRAWGLPRSAGQVHGLLLSVPEPITAEEISAALNVARSNVSTSLRDLRAMGLIRPAPDPGARREKFEALEDPWQAAAGLAAWRRAREVDPAVAALSCTAKASKGQVAKRLAAYAGMAEAAGNWGSGPALTPPPPPKKKKKKKQSG
jgi:DNA-binding transcriptional regulator GbsR (MarR family)